MANAVDIDICKKYTITLNEENFYFTVGESFMYCTVPRENDPMMSDTRKKFEAICSEVTRVLLLNQENKENYPQEKHDN